MSAQRSTTVLIAMAAASLALAVVPAGAQSPTDSPVVVAKKKPIAKPTPTQVALASRPPARVTVRRRSFLDPGTETKAHAEHSTDYAFPPFAQGPTNGGYSFSNDYNVTFGRSVFPTCFDLAGFCR
jgi:hypothetical protein